MAEWSNRVNTNFYGEDGRYLSNREKIEFKSGRTIYSLNNSVPKKEHALKLRVNDTDKADGKTEFEWFLYWYENTIKSGTIPFLLADIVTGTGLKNYMLTEEPNWSGQAYKEISITLEEV